MSGGGDIYYQQPPPAGGGAFAVQAWSTGLLDCFDDIGNCAVTFLCPCVTFGQVAEIVDRGSSSCGGTCALYALIVFLTGSCQFFYSCFYRNRMRAQYHLEESPCADVCVHFWCEPCALCQEYRELKHRGFDMDLGWHANMERQGQMASTMAPQMQPGMTR